MRSRAPSVAGQRRCCRRQSDEELRRRDIRSALDRRRLLPPRRLHASRLPSLCWTSIALHSTSHLTSALTFATDSIAAGHILTLEHLPTNWSTRVAWRAHATLNAASRRARTWTDSHLIWIDLHRSKRHDCGRHTNNNSSLKIAGFHSSAREHFLLKARIAPARHDLNITARSSHDRASSRTPGRAGAGWRRRGAPCGWWECCDAR